MPKPTRRTWLKKTLGAAVGAGAVLQARGGRAQNVRRFAMAIDLDRCVRCGSCIVACAAENNVPSKSHPAGADERPIHWMDFLPAGHAIPGVGSRLCPIPCMHCEDSACTRVCPVGATYQTPEGIVAQIGERCIGCRACMVVCPYSRRYYNFSTPFGSGDSPRNPEVAVRKAGMVEKCTFCHHRIQAVILRARLEATPIEDSLFRALPACAAACPAQAIVFGDTNDPQSQVGQLARSPRAVRLLAQLGTGPKVFYLSGGKS